MVRKRAQSLKWFSLCICHGQSCAQFLWPPPCCSFQTLWARFTQTSRWHNSLHFFFARNMQFVRMSTEIEKKSRLKVVRAAIKSLSVALAVCFASAEFASICIFLCMFFQKHPVCANSWTPTHNVYCECLVFYLFGGRNPHCGSRSRSSRSVLSLFSRPQFKSPVLSKLNNLHKTVFCQVKNPPFAPSIRGPEWETFKEV